jgi:hypothetical protein
MSLINRVDVRIEDNESMLPCNRVVTACGRLLIGGGVAAMKDHHKRHGGGGAVARWDVHRVAVDVAAGVYARVLIAAGPRSWALARQCEADRRRDRCAAGRQRDQSCSSSHHSGVVVEAGASAGVQRRGVAGQARNNFAAGPSRQTRGSRQPDKVVAHEPRPVGFHGWSWSKVSCGGVSD